jgi:phosphoribosylformylglycinamidine synthase
LQDLLDDFRSQDRLVLGICNGFQVMMRLGIFFPPDLFPEVGRQQPATLALNAQARFEDRWVHLTNFNSNSIFLRNIEHLFLPMAHAEGRFVVANDATATQMLQAGQLGLRYCTSQGEPSDLPLDFPDNPNGADFNVAGISDPTGRIFGLMPHPERYMDPTHHPFWTRLDSLPEYGEGRQMFQNAVDYFQ